MVINERGNNNVARIRCAISLFFSIAFCLSRAHTVYRDWLIQLESTPKVSITTASCVIHANFGSLGLPEAFCVADYHLFVFLVFHVFRLSKCILEATDVVPRNEIIIRGFEKTQTLIFRMVARVREFWARIRQTRSFRSEKECAVYI